LWAAVQELAIAERYVFVPDLFDLTKTISDPAELKAASDRILSEKLPREQPNRASAAATAR
jgi:hypothetical protein